METHPELFHKTADKFGKPDIDLFASKINRQVKRYASWHPEPEAMAVNAFSLTWSSNYFYMLLPFSAIDQVVTQGQERSSYSGIKMVNSIMVPSADADDQS